ncbi:MAG: hypothetical protein MI702_06605, partial [Chlorobiales bacterium]|nr:hypothetical protein [Chlorobiales bacterium]
VRGRVDDWRLYAKALSADELAEVMRGEPWLAWNPQPGNGVVTDVERASMLSWSAGDGAVAHNVFVALDADTLRNADDTDTTGVYRGQYTETAYALEGVQADITYYWRIDEVQADGSVRKGNPWKFTTAAYLIIDNFNDYSGESGMEVYLSWIDGYADPALGGSYTGHADPPYVEKSISSSPSLPLYYNNDGATFTHEDGTTSTPTFSEVKHLLEGNERNWTRHSVETLSISYHGVEAGTEDDTTGNIPDRFYVAIEDGSGKVAVFDHPDNPNAVTRAAWEPAFVIALADIAALGVDLTDVASITFGVGQPGGPAGGVGVLYIDDVLLYPTMPDDPNDPDIPEVPAPADI